MGFRSNPLRDASAIIAGYLYQVDVTVSRWLNLQTDEVLELERGEDLDVVRVSDDHVEDLRTLEQVKDRAAALTLRSANALEALANFCEHRKTNPKHRLNFRYITTSRIGREKGWKSKQTAIELWESIRIGVLDADGEVGGVLAISQFLQDCEKPDGVKTSTWNSLTSILTDQKGTEFRKVIQSFEWATSGGDSAFLEESIRRGLIQSKYAANDGVAQGLLERLFFYVFKRLSEKGRKTLTAEEFRTQLTQASLDASDLDFMTDVRALSSRVANLERETAQDRAVLKSVYDQVQKIAEEYHAVIDYEPSQVSLDAPEMVVPGIPRSQVVDEVVGEMDKRTWVSIAGEPGSGKTQLCLLATRRLRSAGVWINLRTLNQERSCMVIDATLEASSGVTRHPLIKEWYRQVAARLEPGTTIILDDLQAIVIGSALEQRLQFLQAACKECSLRLLSATYYEMPRALVETDVVGEVHAPRFTAKEILELVQAHGAPTRLTNINFAEFLRVSTGGLPVVVAAVVQFLISKNWISEAKDIESLFKRDYAKSIQQDARKLIEATVPDLDARELLYRLTCVIGPISRLHVERVGKVAAEIKLSMEKLNHLVGLWVQPYGTDKYLLSPLVDNGLANLLDSNTRKRVHRALGGIILRGKLAVLDIVICVTHFHEAAMNSTAAVVLLQAIIKIMDYDSEVPNESIMSALWAEVPLPGDIDINLRLNLRAAQIALADKRNKDCSFLNGDLRELLDQAQGDDKAQLGMFMASCLLVTRFFRKDPRMSNRYILTALRSAPKAVLPDGSKLSIPTEMSLESMLWGTAAAAKSVAEVEDWLETVGQLSPGQVQALSGSQFAADNSTVLCDSVWLREYHKPHGERDWDAVEKMMKLIERRSRDLGLDLLNAAALRTQIVILAEQRNRLADAVSMAEETLRTATSDGVRFLIEEATGRQLAYAGRWEEALLWMGRAIGRDVDGLTPLRRNLLVTISEGVARYDLAAAVGYARQAVEIAKSADLVSAQVAEALGEYAIALWGADQREMSFVQWQEAVQLLVGAVDRPPAHTETFLAFLHAAGYFSSMVIFGSPPNADYEAPEPGFFLNTFRFRPETYMISQNRLLYFHTAMFAEGVQDTDAAWRWAKLALGGNSSEVESDLRRPFVWLTIAPAILAGDYGYAIEKAYSTLVPVSSTNDSGNSPAPPSVAPEILARGPLEVSLILCFVPLAFRLATVRFDREISVDLEAVNRCVEGLSGDADEWKEAARLVKSILSNTVPWREFFQAGGKHYSENHVTLGALCFVGSILSAPEGQSLYSQIDLARILDKLFETRPSIRYKILLPFFQKYWDSAITSGSATFRTSAEYTRRNFDEAVASPVRVRLKEIFKSMVFCIGLSLPSNLRNWLEA